MDKMSYEEFLEVCVENGYTATVDELQEAYDIYLNESENNNEDMYVTMLEFCATNGVVLTEDQLNALQEKSSAWNRYIDSKAAKSDRYVDLSKQAVSPKTEKLAISKSAKVDKVKNPHDRSNSISAKEYKTLRDRASFYRKDDPFNMSREESQTHFARNSFKSRGVDKIGNRKPGTYAPKN